MKRLKWAFCVFISLSSIVLCNNQDGKMSTVFGVDWNGTVLFLTDGNLTSQPFPSLTLYENNFYIFDHNGSSDIRFYIGENNNSAYLKSDVWNNGALSDQEYLFFHPDLNTSRTLYYFNPENNGTVGQIEVNSYDSALFFPTENVSSAKFGQSILINDWNQTILGAPGEAGFDDGAVHVFNHESNGSYSFLEKIVPPIVGQTAQFGHSLAASNQYLFIGSPDVSNYSGLVDVFIRESNGSYNYDGNLSFALNSGDSFGWNMSADGTNLAVGSLQAINNGRGSVSIFENNGTNWNFYQNVFAKDENNQSDDEFGYDIELVGDRLIVGAPKVDANGTDSGSAYIFEKNASVWEQTCILSPSGLSSGDEFGYSVELSDNLAFVGARQRDGNSTNAGVVYVFRFEGTNWVEIDQIYPPTNMANQYFSSDLDVRGDLLAVSSPMLGEGSISIYRLENNGSNINHISELGLSEANSSDQSNISLALLNGSVLVGIPGDSTKASAGGAAFAFYNDAWQFKNIPLLPPIIDHNSTVLHSMNEDSGTYFYDFNGSHPIDTDIHWSLTQFSDGNATFDLNASTGSFSYTPDGNFSGIHSFSLLLSSGELQDSLDFNVSVLPDQDEPIFEGPFNLTSGMEGDEYNQTILVRDSDGDLLTLSYVSPFFGLGITSGFDLTGTPIKGSPDSQPFEDQNITLSLNDGNGNIVQKIFSIRILERNNPPLIWVDGNSSVTTFDINLTEDFNANEWYAVLPHLDYNDPDGHHIDLNVSVNPSYGNLTWDKNATDTNQSITYFPLAPNFNGNDSFKMILRDMEGEGNKSTTLTFNINISPVNDPPDIVSAPPMSIVSEGNLFSYQLILEDPDLNDVGSNEKLNVTIENLPPSGWLEYNSSSKILSGVPSWSDYEESGPRLIVIKVQDSSGLVDTQAFTLEVKPNNYPPVITEGSSYTTAINEDSSINTWHGLDLNTTALDVTRGVLVWEIFEQAQNGTATVSGTGMQPAFLSYQPDGNFSGPDYFLLKVFESLDPNASDTIRINVNVLPIADDPLFMSLTSGVAVQDFLFDYNITTFDADTDSNLTISSLVPLPSWLVLNDSGNGNARLTGRPDQYDLGNNLIVLEVRDETNRFAIQAFMLVVIDQNTNPVITQGDTVSFTLAEDSVWYGHSLISATDLDGQFLNWKLKSEPSHGSVQVSGQGSSPSVLEYLPDSNYSGSDSFQIEVSDGIEADHITINLTIQNVNDAPIFLVQPTDQVTIDNQIFNISPVAYDADGLSAATAVISGPTWLSVYSFDRSSGVIHLSGTPKENHEGSNAFSLVLTDATGMSVTKSFNVQVRVLNYAPSINDGDVSVSVTMIEDNATTWSPPFLVGTDIETSVGNLAWSVFSQPSDGNLSISGTGPSPTTFEYLPDGNFSGSDSFIVKVTDSGGIESSPPKYDTILVNVEVIPVNDPPVFISTPESDRNGSYSWNDESVYIYEIKTFDSDYQYSWHSLDLNVSGSLPSWLSFRDEGNGTGTLYGLAGVSDEGNHSVSFEVFDSNNTSAVQNFTLQIRIDNYPPIFQSISDPSKTISELVVYVDEDTNPQSPVRGWITPTDYRAIDPDASVQSNSKALSWSVDSQPLSGGTTSVSGLGERPTTFSYSTFKDFFGDDLFNIKVNDGWRDSVLPVRVKVRGLPDMPFFTTSFTSIPVAKEGAQFNFDISTGDPDNSPRTVKVFGLPSEGRSWLKLVDVNSTTGTARLYGVPPSQSSGKRYQLAFVVTDETGLFAVANGQLHVDGKNASPVINAGSEATVRFDQNGNANQNDLSFLYATDVEGAQLQWSLSKEFSPKYGRVTVSGTGTSIPFISYKPYSGTTGDSFRVRVSDGVSFDEIEISAVVVDNFDLFEVSSPSITSISRGQELSEYFKVSNVSGSQSVSAFILEGPTWLKIKKIGSDVFHLHGVVPTFASAHIPIKIQFLEDGQSKATKEYILSLVDSYPPNLSLLGDDFIQLPIGQEYLEPGYQSIDQDGTNLSSAVLVTGNVNVNQPGFYELNYRSEDLSGNISELKRKVQVLELNNSVGLNFPIAVPGQKIDDFKLLDDSLIVLEHTTDGDSRVAQYKDTSLSSLVRSFSFKADYVRLELVNSLKDGGYLVGGIFRGNLEFGSHLVASKGNHNAFALKLDSNFQKVWFRTLSASSTIRNLVAFESADLSIRLAGDFAGVLQMDSRTWTSGGASDNFILHLKDNGEFNSIITFGESDAEEMVGIDEMSEGFYVVASNSKKSSTLSNCTIVKFNSQNEVVTGKTVNNGYYNRASALEISDGMIFLAGGFETELKIDDKRVSTNASRSGFVCNLSSDLKANWIEAFSSNDICKVESIKMDAFGHPLVIVSYSGTISFPSGLSGNLSLGQSDLLIAKLNRGTGSLIWAESLGTYGNDEFLGFDADSFGSMQILAGMKTPFVLNGVTQTEGNEFFIKVNSISGNPVFDSVSNLELIDGIFFKKQIDVLNQPVVKMKILKGPTWLNFYDNFSGSGLLGGLPNQNESSFGEIRIRAYNGSGGVSDLDFNYTIKAGNFKVEDYSIPSISSVINFQSDVSISTINSSDQGYYLVGGIFESSIQMAGSLFSSVGKKDGFVSQIGLDGKPIRSVQLISSGHLSIKKILSGDNGDSYIIGDFTIGLQVGTYEIKPNGESDIFILQWGKNGELKNLSALGGSENEYFSDASVYKNSLLLAGNFEGTFKHGLRSVQSNGEKDGFVMQVPLADLSTVEWLQSFGGSQNDQVNGLVVSSSGKVFLSGSFISASTFGSEAYQSVGLQDCFVGELDLTGKWINVQTAGSSGVDEITSILLKENNLLYLAGNFQNVFRWGNRKVQSNGKQDGFIAVLSESGHCISLNSYGGAGNDEINSLIGYSDQTHIIGTFDNSIVLGSKTFTTRGKRDGFIANISGDSGKTLDAYQVGGDGQDSLLKISSLMDGHFLISGVVTGQVSVSGEVTSSSDRTPRSFVSLWGGSNVLPVLSPEPITSILTSKMYEYEFTSGPWPSGADVDLQVIQKPNWLNIEIFENGKGLVWGRSPSVTSLPEKVQFALFSEGLPTLFAEWDLQVIDAVSAFSIVGEPVLYSSQFQPYRSQFSLIDSSPGKILVLAKSIPSWMTLNRISDNFFQIEGTPGKYDLGVSQVEIFVSKIIDHNTSHEDTIKFSVTIQPKILEETTSLNIGSWRTNWFGYFESFDNLWTYHQDFGWVYLGTGDLVGGVWFWTEKWGWFWTNSTNWDSTKGQGYLFNSLLNEWTFFRRKESDLPNVLHLYSEGRWYNYD